MNKEKLEEFLIKARKKTYAGGDGKVKPALSGSTQLEFKDGDWFYRDVYYTGKNTFMGIETVYFEDKPVFSTSYYGNWGNMTEKEIDNILRGALLANPETRSYKHIKWTKGEFIYECTPDTNSIDEISGTETISKTSGLASTENDSGGQVYYFYYAGSLVSK